MRSILRQQQPLMQELIEHEHAHELAAIDQILNSVPEVLAQVEADLVGDSDRNVGRPGLCADQVVRALLVKQMNGFSYDELAFHLADSICYRRFCQLGEFEKPPSRSTLQENIKRLSPESLEAINRAIVMQAKEDGLDDGSTVRGDCTVVDSNIHHPTDSWLLWDTVRVAVRLLQSAWEYDVRFTNHQRRAKRRFREIGNARNREQRVPLYRDLLKMAEETLEDAENAVSQLKRIKEPEAEDLIARLLRTLVLGRRIVDQTRRRVLDEESVPSSEKLVSIFEPHTDIIVKDRRGVEYGHKICLTAGLSSLVFDCVILEGNPADSTLATRMIERHREIFSEAPEQAAFDGGFASKSNVDDLKKIGVKDVAFSKRCGLSISDMVKDSWVYKRLRDFRAGIEGIISFLKRAFGLRRCPWSGFKSFKAYVWGSILSANLLTLARHRLVM